MKTSTLIPVVAYLGLAGYTAAAPVNVESTQALDKRTFCFFGIGWGCPAPAPAPAPAKPAATSAAVSSKAAVSSSSAVKSSAAASSSAKVVSSAAASSSAKAVVPTSASATKVTTAAWSQCTDFDWNSWGSDWTWGGGFDKDYVKSWYVAEYGFAPPQGMNWKQVSSLVSQFGQKTKPASPKTTSKYTGKGCSNPWTSVVNTKTAVVTAQPVTSTAASKPVVTSAAASSAAVSKASSSAAAASSAAVSKPASSAAASSASSSVAKPVASSSSSAVVVAPASSAAASSAASSAAASSAAPSSAASSAASSASASPVASSAAASSAAASPVASSAAASSAAASSAAASSDAAPVASSAAAPSASAAAPSSDAAPASSSAAAVASPSPSPDATSASSAAASPSAGTGSGSDGSSGTPGTGSGSSDGSAGVPGSGAGSNTATGTSTSDAPVATSSNPSVVNGFTAGGCVQEVSNRLLNKVQTSSPSMTIEMCTATCDSYGYAVAGLEYGSECYCGELSALDGALVSGECKMACSGSPDEICGGPNAINVYIDASNVPATVVLPSGWTTYGVVTEGDNGRLLPVQLYSSSENTIEKCANACAAANYLISGTEYSSECFCGNAFVAAAGGGQLVDDSAAFMMCSGNAAQACGGPSILSVTSAFGQNIPSA